LGCDGENGGGHGRERDSRRELGHCRSRHATRVCQPGNIDGGKSAVELPRIVAAKQPCGATFLEKGDERARDVR
jgi:hypothetical protein